MKKILLIDDQVEILELLGYFFKQLHFKVSAFTDIIPLKAIAEIAPDVIALDYRIGDKFGSDFCKEIKSNTQTGHIPVVILSADEGLSQIARDSCADGYLTKPFDIERLHQTIKNVMLSEAS